jgi:predicted enzyme related to lactoylglutathione lyase
MPEMTSYAPGTPSWVDLGTPDPAEAARFYGGLLGWTIEEGAADAGGYRMCLLDGKPVAGLGPQMNPDMPPWWTTYVTVANADETAAAIREAGGSLFVEPMDVLDAGRMAVAGDSTGAVFSIWEPRAHISAAIVNDPNSFCWNELTTRRPVESIAFYDAVFGWEAHTSEGPMEYTEFQVGGRSIAGMTVMEGDSWPAELPNHWMVYFAVADADASVAKATELGGSVSVPPTDIPLGRFAMLHDPQGTAFSILAFAAS